MMYTKDDLCPRCGIQPPLRVSLVPVESTVGPGLPLDRAFNLFRGTGRYLEYALQSLDPISRAAGWTPRIEVVPDALHAELAADEFYEQRVSVPVGSRLWALACFEAMLVHPESCEIQIWDLGTGRTIWPGLTFYSHITGQGNPLGIVNGAGAAQIISNPLHVLPTPYIVVEPGQLKVQIHSLNNAAKRTQLALYFAIPPAVAEADAGNQTLAAEDALARGAKRERADLYRQAGALDPLDLPAQPMALDFAAIGDNILVPGTEGYRIAIYALELQAAGAVTVTLKNGAKAVRGPLTFAGAGGWTREAAPPKEPHWVCDYGQPFIATLSAGVQVTGDLKYRMLDRWGV